MSEKEKIPSKITFKNVLNNDSINEEKEKFELQDDYIVKCHACDHTTLRTTGGGRYCESGENYEIGVMLYCQNCKKLFFGWCNISPEIIKDIVDKYRKNKKVVLNDEWRFTSKIPPLKIIKAEE